MCKFVVRVVQRIGVVAKCCLADNVQGDLTHYGMIKSLDYIRNGRTRPTPLIDPNNLAILRGFLLENLVFEDAHKAR